jgi:hypothetical protein
MKKLSLILFISFTFLGSVNANSIKGAFGYELGAKMKDIPTTYSKFTSYGTDYYSFSSSKKFIPKKPLPSLDNYVVRTTYTDKKIHSIEAFTSEKYSKYQKGCLGRLDQILVLLRARYGEFDQDYNFYLYDGKYDANGDYYSVRNERYIYQDKNRRIILSCESDSRNSNYLSLEYRDDNLWTQSWDESDKLEKQKIIEASDYDI